MGKPQFETIFETRRAAMNPYLKFDKRKHARISRIASFLLLGWLVLLVGSEVSADQPPNIIVILADDLGYGDLSCYGATQIATPNIDQLASEGMRFTDAHAAASLCSPSRYGLLTGRAPWRLHKKGNGYRIGRDQLTIAGFLQESGYTSAAIGKWHLGYGKDWNKPPISGPLNVGFDYHFGVPSNHNDDTRLFIENDDIYGRKPGEPYRIVKGEDFPEGVATPRVEDQVDKTLTDKAVAFIERNAEGPFFLYFAPCAPHTHVTPAAEFRGSSQAGLYGDYVQELDSHVGTILQTLDQLKLSDETIVIFTSDNGSTPKDFKGTQNVNLNLLVDSDDIRVRFKTAKADAKKLGHVTNGPWRDGKGRAYEGGHRIPMVARWPAKIPADAVSDCTTSLSDLFATFAELVERELPPESAEDSTSILSVLLGEENRIAERDSVFIMGNGKDSAIAVCSGQWKLIVRYGNEKERGHELYDLQADPGEQNNLSEEHPEIVKTMFAAYQTADTNGRTR